MSSVCRLVGQSSGIIRRSGTAVLVGLVLVSCSPSPDAPGQSYQPIGSADIDPVLLEPLTALGPCVDPPADAIPAEEVAFGLPPDAVVVESVELDPVVQVEGYVPLTPIQLRVEYADRTDLVVLSAEDEVHEAEVVFTADERRVYIKAQAVCESASLFVAVIAPEDAAEAVPTPLGTPAPR